MTTWTRVWYKGDGGSLMLAARTQGNSKDRFPILTVKFLFFFPLQAAESLTHLSTRQTGRTTTFVAEASTILENVQGHIAALH